MVELGTAEFTYVSVEDWAKVPARGGIYAGQVSWTQTGSLLKPPRELRSLQKLIGDSKP